MLAALAALAALAGCASDDGDGDADHREGSETTTSSPSTSAVPTGAEVTVEVGETAIPRLWSTRSTPVIDDGRYVAGVANEGARRTTAVVVADVARDELVSAEVPVPDGWLASWAWVAGGGLHALVFECTEHVAMPDGSEPEEDQHPAERECLRGNESVVSMPNPLMADAPDMSAWSEVVLAEDVAVGDAVGFEFSSDRTAYLNDGRTLVTLTYDTGALDRYDAPRQMVAGVCGDEDDAHGVVVVLAGGEETATAEPDRQQTFGDLTYARLDAEGRWTDVPAGGWDPDAAALGGRCIGASPSVIDWTTAEAWVLGEGDEWASWGELEIDGFVPNTHEVGGDFWAVGAPDRIVVTSLLATTLFGPDGITEQVDVPTAPSAEAVPVWGLVLDDGRYVGQAGDPATGVTPELVRGSVQ